MSLSVGWYDASMNVHLPAPRRRWPARLVDLAVVVVLLALAAATFVLSYTGVHVIALQAGVSPRFARVYPGTFDAVLVIACVAALVLRDARWWARGYAWLVIILTMAVVGTADAVHAMNIALPHQKMEGVVAAAPWVLVLIGFSLMLTILRHPRPRHAAAEPASAGEAPRSAEQIALPPATTEQPAELARSTAPALPQAEPPTADDHAPTVVVPALTETADAHTGPSANAGPGANAGLVADAILAPDAGLAANANLAAEALPAEPALRWRVADSGPARSWHDYWDAEDTNAPAEPSNPPDLAETGAPGGQSNPLAAPTEAAPREQSDPATAASSRQAHPGAAVASHEHEEPSEAAAEADVDAAPFATAPFGTIPTLNRVRSTPTPPGEDEE